MIQLLHTFLPAIGALAGVLGLVLGIGLVVRYLGFARPPRPGRVRRMSIQDTLVLDRTRRLHLIRCDQRDLLVISGGATAETVVGWLPALDGQA